jgi:hypothetical protein
MMRDMTVWFKCLIASSLDNMSLSFSIVYIIICISISSLIKGPWLSFHLINLKLFQDKFAKGLNLWKIMESFIVI